MDNSKDNEIIRKLRKRVFITGYRGGMAHLASCFSCIEMLYALYAKEILRYDPNAPQWADRDRFILSKGHAGLALYAVLAEVGLIEDHVFSSYLQDNTIIGGEPCMRDCEWIEATTGSLGHGLSMGLGIAIALKLNNSPSKVYVMLGDGELEEGSVWEAIMTAAAFNTTNLIAILDNNRIQKMDFVTNTIGEPRWADKFSSFGWNVLEVDGHDVDEFAKCVNNARDNSDKPTLIIADTIKGKGVTIMENNPVWHFKLPGKKELVTFMEELDISDSEL